MPFQEERPTNHRSSLVLVGSRPHSWEEEEEEVLTGVVVMAGEVEQAE